ncbi:hypothetical protein QEH42_gp153 [Microbacterium phage Pumpernickel]|uniref:Uncharacterized protein n=1 Tax=Microbacterium phage Pumpernickel TaxID=2885983 RepID=A0AAE8Y7F2_9CAUD|nr:hypothetical protein QEH42_gp014 [Microbacterium phage Pumpernickel]YP_010755305.1 hypothetical protein QEH42_gp153 [Microbacterium phage Pumpernickel]UDL15805.1 hypothetical protein SEA_PUMPERNICKEL_14 [Microbacterium phage Pumpernickel]UDL16065.1 hypothetical protein SEA_PUMPERNICKEL_315 [Microbacterium phage Pumpernickel]
MSGGTLTNPTPVRKYTLVREGETVHVEHDPGDNLLVLPGAGVGMSIFSWLEQGWEIKQYRDTTTSSGKYVMSQAVRNHLFNGNKISAIKQVRAETSMSLGEAKSVVDNWDGR